MTTQLIEYNVTQAAIAELTKEKETLLNASELDYKAIKDAKNRNGKIRIAIEKRRKEYIDFELAALQKEKDILERAQIEGEEREVVAEKVRVEYIKDRIEKIQSYKNAVICLYHASHQKDLIDEFNEYNDSKFDFMEFQNEAAIAIKETAKYLKDKFDSLTKFEAKNAAAKKAEDERLKQVAKEEVERKAANATEDRVRNTAPDLLEALENITEFVMFYSNPENISTEGQKNIKAEKSVALKQAQEAIKLAKGE